MRFWWDKGILWISIGLNRVLHLNSYEAQELLALLLSEQVAIDAQAIIDEKEFGR